MCYTDPEIWCVMDVIFIFHLGLFFFLPFHPPSNPKNQNLKKKKKKKGQEHFLLFWPIFCPCAPLRTQIKIKKKNEKSTGRYHHFTHVYHKWQSYDVWFLRYGVQWTEFFVILDHFFPFTPITTQKIKTSTKWKKHLDISSFYTSVSKKKKMIIYYTAAMLNYESVQVKYIKLRFINNVFLRFRPRYLFYGLQNKITKKPSQEPQNFARLKLANTVLFLCYY